ncbi:hypothetical protein EZV62_011597 [Acer yangbiense]|uniref:Protein kinase domain-containing protein n=1 Tax=Acer yangbiense TaxID=1000413 RepID=A0A5C7I500_9ROSI|nr:hypothetical protein EZV62_011597 [Acer yangbiense]
MSSSSMAILLVFLLALSSGPFTAFSASSSSNNAAFTPQDNILIDCGGKSSNTLPDGRVFKTDQESVKYLKTNKDVQVSDDSANVSSPIYQSARIFTEESTYAFEMTRPGWHWVRLHFFPLSNKEFDLQKATFTVSTDKYVLLYNFKLDVNTTQSVLKEYMLNVTDPKLSIKFTPMKNSAAFINAIEVVSAPDSLMTDQGQALFPVNSFDGLSKFSYQCVYRLNVGGSFINSQNDTIGRTWISDSNFLKEKNLAKSVSVGSNVIKYPEGVTPLIAPASVYASASAMADSQTSNQNFNVTWDFDVDSTFSYVIRMHFCDIVSKSLNDLYFNVYVNGKMAISGLDLSSLTGALATPYYKDIVVNASFMSNGLSVQVGPMNENTGTRNALLNGLEILKMSNTVDSLDGEFGVDGQQVSSTNRGTVAAVGFAMMFGAFVGLGAMVIKWHKRPQDWEKRNSFSSWLLPLHTGDASSFMSSKSGSHKSGFTSSALGLGRDHLYGKSLPALSWKQRLEISIGAARGLHYLHTGTAQGIIHRDVKTTNILLDDNFVAKVADFGLSKDATMGQGHVSTAVKGSFGYLDPEYFRRQQLTDKSDVYSFGVVLLEVLCCRPAINPQLPREQVNLAEWAMQWKRKGLLEKIIDPKLLGSINPESMKKYAEAAEKCLAEHGVDRPTMGDVLWNLEYALQLQEAFTEGKTEEDETKLTPTVPAPTSAAPTSASDSDDPPPAEKKTEAPQPHPVDDHSGTAMFAQFAGLNGSLAVLLFALSKPCNFCRRGLSRYYSGKARSFTCMADARSVEDLKKQEHPDAKKRKKYSLNKRQVQVPPHPCRRVSSTNHFSTPYVH